MGELEEDSLLYRSFTRLDADLFSQIPELVRSYIEESRAIEAIGTCPT